MTDDELAQALVAAKGDGIVGCGPGDYHGGWPVSDFGPDYEIIDGVIYLGVNGDDFYAYPLDIAKLRQALGL